MLLNRSILYNWHWKIYTNLDDRVYSSRYAADNLSFLFFANFSWLFLLAVVSLAYGRNALVVVVMAAAYIRCHCNRCLLLLSLLLCFSCHLSLIYGSR